MKANFTEEYYRNNFDKLIKESNMNLEEKLEFNTKFLKDIDLPEDAVKIAKRTYAEEIAKDAEKELKERMKVAKGIQNGSVSFGYTTAIQENKERSNYIKMFEFDCYQLSVFKKVYGI